MPVARKIIDDSIEYIAAVTIQSAIRIRLARKAVAAAKEKKITKARYEINARIAALWKLKRNMQLSTLASEAQNLFGEFEGTHKELIEQILKLLKNKSFLNNAYISLSDYLDTITYNPNTYQKLFGDDRIKMPVVLQTQEIMQHREFDERILWLEKSLFLTRH